MDTATNTISFEKTKYGKSTISNFVRIEERIKSLSERLNQTLMKQISQEHILAKLQSANTQTHNSLTQAQLENQTLSHTLTQS